MMVVKTLFSGSMFAVFYITHLRTKEFLSQVSHVNLALASSGKVAVSNRPSTLF